MANRISITATRLHFFETRFLGARGRFKNNLCVPLLLQTANRRVVVPVVVIFLTVAMLSLDSVGQSNGHINSNQQERAPLRANSRELSQFGTPSQNRIGYNPPAGGQKSISRLIASDAPNQSPVQSTSYVPEPAAPTSQPKLYSAIYNDHDATGSVADGEQTPSSVKTMLPQESVPYDINELNQRDPSNPKVGGSQFELGKTVQKIIFTTMGVLAACVFVLVALKKMGYRPNAAQNVESGSMTIVDSIVIGPKCTVQVVQINRQKLAVAMDATGIKSMVPLGGSFAEEMTAADRRNSDLLPLDRRAMHGQKLEVRGDVA